MHERGVSKSRRQRPFRQSNLLGNSTMVPGAVSAMRVEEDVADSGAETWYEARNHDQKVVIAKCPVHAYVARAGI